MVAAQTRKGEARVLELFAELLEYPRPGLAQKARDCRDLLVNESTEAAGILGEFAAFVERTPHATLEEIFTATFDLNATCHPYIGYHLFGEDYRRSAFLLELKERFRERGLDSGVELPDHLCMLLRFIALSPDDEGSTEIVREALLPTLGPMTLPPDAEPAEGEEEKPEVFDVGDDYRRLVHALRLVLEARYGVPVEHAPIPLPEEERLVS